MRISDWSSDVCSSDLTHRPDPHYSACRLNGGDPAHGRRQSVADVPQRPVPLDAGPRPAADPARLHLRHRPGEDPPDEPERVAVPAVAAGERGDAGGGGPRELPPGPPLARPDRGAVRPDR